MIDHRLVFLNNAFSKFDLQFADNFSNAIICNPNYNENISVYDNEYEFIVCFSFQHRHFEDQEDVVAWIREITAGNLFAIEFFNKGQRRFGSEINAKLLQDLTYEKLEQFAGYYGLTKLSDVADSFKIRGWDRKNNYDFTFAHNTNGFVVINKIYVGIL